MMKTVSIVKKIRFSFCLVVNVKSVWNDKRYIRTKTTTVTTTLFPNQKQTKFTIFIVAFCFIVPFSMRFSRFSAIVSHLNRKIQEYRMATRWKWILRRKCVYGIEYSWWFFFSIPSSSSIHWHISFIVMHWIVISCWKLSFIRCLRIG